MKFTSIFKGLLLLALFANYGCKESHNEICSIKGEITGLPNGTIISLQPVSHSKEEPIGICTVSDGHFEWSDTITEPLAVRLYVDSGYFAQRSIMMLEPGNISIKASATKTEEEKYPYEVENLVITGSPLTDQYRQLMTVRDSPDSIHRANRIKHADFTKSLAEARMAKNQILVDSLLASPEFEEMNRESGELFKYVGETFTNAILEHKDSYWGPLLMLTLYVYFDKDQREVFEQFSDEAQNCRYGQMIKKELYPVGRIGDKLSDFKALDQEGNEVDLYEVCKDHKLVIIDFWASWCVPCRKSIPGLKKIYERYKDAGLGIVSISIDKNKADWEKALEAEQLPWVALIDSDETASKAYNVKAIPAIYVVNSNCELMEENLRDEALEERIGELISED